MDRQEANEFRIRVFGSAEVIAFICECADERCRRTVMLSPGAYLSRREHGEAIVFPGHVPIEDAAMAGERDLASAETGASRAAVKETRPAG